jgi:hypothetical protein
MRKLIFALATATILTSAACNTPQGNGNNASGSNPMSVADSMALVKQYLKDHVVGLKSGANSAIVNNSDLLFPETATKTELLPEKMLRGVNDKITIDNYFLEVDVSMANSIISAYNSAFGYKSFMIKAAPLVDYINYAEEQRTPIVNFRLMMGIFQDSSGGQQNTMAVVGLDKDNKYILNRNGKVYEHCLPCPNECPTNNGQPIKNIIEN